MHKKIVHAITEAISQHNKDPEIVKIFVDDKTTDGFWRMLIVVNPDPKYRHFVKRIHKLGMEIGRFYGEGLWDKVKWNTIEFS